MFQTTDDVFEVPSQMRATLRTWRPGVLLSFLSLLGSYGWFAAFALQKAAYVCVLGQVELTVAAIVGFMLLGETPKRRELVGMSSLTHESVNPEELRTAIDRF
jgi:drug/metabolite transporter (DMT)-like permease